ncbi:unnamed protein product [Pichia kudriavzevii]
MQVTRYLLRFDKSYLKNLRVSHGAHGKSKKVSPKYTNSPSNSRGLGSPLEKISVLPEKERFHREITLGSQYRERAGVLYRRRNSLFSQSQEAFLHGNKENALELAGEARAIADEAAQCSQRAAQHIFSAHNPQWSRGHFTEFVDLHGLHVDEGIYYFSEHLIKCIRREQYSLNVVVGVGRNSSAEKGGPVLAEAIVSLCGKLDIFVCEDEPGRLAVLANRGFDSRSGEIALLAFKSDVWW